MKRRSASSTKWVHPLLNQARTRAFFNIVRGVYALWYTRLEKGSFRFPTTASASETHAVEVKAADLMMILDGVDLGSVRRQRRYSRETVENPPVKRLFRKHS